MEKQDRQKPTSPRCLKCGEQPQFTTSMPDLRPGGRSICSNVSAALELVLQRRLRAASVGDAPRWQWIRPRILVALWVIWVCPDAPVAVLACFESRRYPQPGP